MMQLNATEPDRIRHNAAAHDVMGLAFALAETPGLSQPLIRVRQVASRPQMVLTPDRYDSLDFAIDPAAGACWCFMRPDGHASFTRALMADIVRMQAEVRRLGMTGLDETGAKLRYFVMGSRTPGIFNLGGDLALFARTIRNRDRDTLRAYGHGCVRALHENTHGYDAGAVTVALVQGDALGGGFEAALAFDMIVAEKQARFGFPEILFNLFPGMGAYSYLARRIAPALAERMILSGRIYTADELHELGVIDMVVDTGQGEQAVRDLITRQGRRHNAQQAIYRVRRRLNPVPLQELLDVVDIWVDAALNLEEADLRKMQRLAAAQMRRCGASPAPAVRTAG